MTTHKCTKCGHEDEINPAAEMGRKKKTMTPEAVAQRKLAAKARWAKVSEEKMQSEVVDQMIANVEKMFK